MVSLDRFVQLMLVFHPNPWSKQIEKLTQQSREALQKAKNVWKETTPPKTRMSPKKVPF